TFFTGSSIFTGRRWQSSAALASLVTKCAIPSVMAWSSSAQTVAPLVSKKNRSTRRVILLCRACTFTTIGSSIFVSRFVHPDSMEIIAQRHIACFEKGKDNVLAKTFASERLHPYRVSHRRSHRRSLSRLPLRHEYLHHGDDQNGARDGLREPSSATTH